VTFEGSDATFEGKWSDLAGMAEKCLDKCQKLSSQCLEMGLLEVFGWKSAIVANSRQGHRVSSWKVGLRWSPRS
jgi:hypothetical protein